MVTGRLVMFALIWGLAPSFVGHADSDEPVLLRFAPDAGSYRDYVVRLVGEVRSGGSGPVALEAAVPLRVRVEECDDKNVRAVRVVFRRAAIELGSDMLPWTLSRQGYAVLRDDRNRITEVRSRCAPMAPRTGDFAALFHDLGWAFILPEDPVRAGDTWSYRIDSEPILFEPTAEETSGRTVEGNFIGEVREVRPVAGEAVAEIRARTTLRTESAAGVVSLQVRMDALLDCATGWLLRADGTVTLAIQPSSGAQVLFPGLRVEVRRYDRDRAPADDGAPPAEDDQDDNNSSPAFAGDNEHEDPPRVA